MKNSLTNTTSPSRQAFIEAVLSYKGEGKPGVYLDRLGGFKTRFTPQDKWNIAKSISLSHTLDYHSWEEVPTH
jgi:hypothetical protein